MAGDRPAAVHQPGSAASDAGHGTPAAGGTSWKDKACRVCDQYGFWKAAMKEDGSASGGGKRVKHTDAASSSSQSTATATATATATVATTPGGQPADSGADGGVAGQEQSGEPSTSGTTSAERLPCPPDSLELGAHSWTFLHSVAAYYPEHPDATAQRAARQLLEAVGVLYPCAYCAEHLRGELAQHPPDVRDRAAFERWLCDVHNEVNARLGKPLFDCSRVAERWREGPADGSCD